MNMESTLITDNSFHEYQDLWNFNIQKIEAIRHQIEKSIQGLEGQYIEFEIIYAEIMKQVDILSSIYSSYNAIEGIEYVMRLKSVFRSYMKRYTREGINFNLIQYLLSKIIDLFNHSFEQFPQLVHENNVIVVSDGTRTSGETIRKKYKWVTFKRNISWFIAPFSEMTILKNENYRVLFFEKPDYININFDDTIIKIKDIFTKIPDERNPPHYYIFLNNRKNNFAANIIGKQIFSDKNIIKPMLRPYKKAISNKLSPGRVRLFGINHIVLY